MPSRRPVAPPRFALFLAIVLAGCGTSNPTASSVGSALASTAGASADATADTSGSSAPASGAIGASGAPSAIPGSDAPASASPSGALDPGGSPGISPAPSAAASRWRTIVPSLAIPAAYLDFGFAGNGDVIVIATDDVTDAKLGLWVARYSPDGTRLSKKTVDRRITQHQGDWIDIDPSNDTVLISERDAGTTTLTGRRISTTTGKTIASIDFHREVRRVAVDESGRMWALSPFYPTFQSRRPCIIDRLGAGGGIAAGVDHWLGTCEERGFDPGAAVFGDPVAIEVGSDGRLLIVDEAAAGQRADAQAAGLALTVLTTGFDLVRQWHIPLEWGLKDVPFASWAQSLAVAGAADGDVYLGEVLISPDGTRSTGFRIRAFDKAGALLTTYGTGGDQAGVTMPSDPNVDEDGRLWVIDLDTATRSYSIKVLE